MYWADTWSNSTRSLFSVIIIEGCISTLKYTLPVPLTWSFIYGKAVVNLYETTLQCQVMEPFCNNAWSAESCNQTASHCSVGVTHHGWSELSTDLQHQQFKGEWASSTDSESVTSRFVKPVCGSTSFAGEYWTQVVIIVLLTHLSACTKLLPWSVAITCMSHCNCTWVCSDWLNMGTVRALYPTSITHY